MITDIDEALRTIVRRDALTGADIDVVFDAPTKDWAARRNAPTVDLYLYDIREDQRRRERGWVDVRDDTGSLVARRPAPRFYRLSYLVTAWTQRPEDEHRLLASLLSCFVRYDAVPPDLAVGVTTDVGVVPMTVGLPPPEDRGFADVWSALGGELKPSLDVVVIVPVEVGVTFPAGPPVTQGPVVTIVDTVGGGRDAHQQKRPQFWPAGAGATAAASGADGGPPGAGGPASGPAGRRRRRGTLHLDTGGDGGS